ncbi:cytochrome c-type biogenesis protein CcmH [Pontibacterium sp.]|jgi:cytochrome c-type biogenesis protein CcmH|uniref:cytochrome c-type biogenesis protein n=1 Tax=Pontibacterium sp. TaxID=2036026 RepID=UPI00356852BA
MKRWLISLLMLVSMQAFAAIDTYDFKDEDTRKRFQQLTEELRCPKCQNQNLSDSNSPIAKDLRHEVYRMLGEGESDSEIADFMVARYGEFVLYKPRKDASTYVLWYGPFGLLLLGLIVVFAITRRKNTAAKESPESNLDDEQRKKLNSLLDQDADK